MTIRAALGGVWEKHEAITRCEVILVGNSASDPIFRSDRPMVLRESRDDLPGRSQNLLRDRIDSPCRFMTFPERRHRFQACRRELSERGRGSPGRRRGFSERRRSFPRRPPRFPGRRPGFVDRRKSRRAGFPVSASRGSAPRRDPRAASRSTEARELSRNRPGGSHRRATARRSCRPRRARREGSARRSSLRRGTSR